MHPHIFLLRRRAVGIIRTHTDLQVLRGNKHFAVSLRRTLPDISEGAPLSSAPGPPNASGGHGTGQYWGGSPSAGAVPGYRSSQSPLPRRSLENHNYA